MVKNTFHLKTTLLFLLVAWMPFLGLAQGNGGEIDWMDYEEASALVKQNPQKIMLFMEADWCAVCKRMKKEVFPDEHIQATINEYFYPVKIDIESGEEIVFKGNRTTKIKLSKELGIYATPTIIFLEADESVIGNKAGYLDVDEFSRLLKYIYTEAYLDTNFEDFKQ